jgi:glycosyltransferase involved in cell wall biosynthesis
MISICIPICNFDVNSLIGELARQIQYLSIPVEIVLIDDASSSSFKRQNDKICKEHLYVELNTNVGRAAIRNLFLEYAQYDYLLFLDCDSLIVSEDYLNSYLLAIKMLQPNVICGGQVFSQKNPGFNRRLRWRFGVKQESHTADYRLKYPDISFMTNNFLIKKSLLQSIKFNEQIKDYGHEDTLFGFELKKRKIAITHIDNPIMNSDVEKNGVFLQKTEVGVSNLVKIQKIVGYDPMFVKDVKILNIYHKVKSSFLILPAYFLFLLLRFPIKQLLKIGLSLWIFDFYKFGILTELMWSKEK